MGKTSKVLGVVAILFFIVLGIAIFVRECFMLEFQAEFWKVYVGSFAGILTAVLGSDSLRNYAKNKFYNPIRDTEHPEVVSAAMERYKQGEST